MDNTKSNIEYTPRSEIEYEANVKHAQEKLFSRFRLLTKEVLKTKNTNLWPKSALEWEKVLLGTIEELEPYLEIMNVSDV
jgi:hypothetical protein